MRGKVEKLWICRIHRHRSFSKLVEMSVDHDAVQWVLNGAQIPIQNKISRIDSL